MRTPRRQSPATVRYRLGAVLLCLAFVAACGDRDSRSANGRSDDKKTVYANEGRLDILAWPGFAVDASGEADDAWLRPFEKASACEVHIQRADDPDQLLAMSEQDGADVVLATGESAGSLIQAGRVRAIERSRVPALSGVMPVLAEGPWATADGITYGVPFQWSAMALQFDPRALGRASAPGMADLFEEKTFVDGRSNLGRVRAFGRPVNIADAALYLRQTRPDLDISDPFALDEAQYAAALDALRQQRRLRAVDDRAAVIAGRWDVASPLPIIEPANGVFLARPDLSTGVVAVSMLHVKSRHPNCALAWLQWSIQPKVQAQVAGQFNTLPVAASACTIAGGLGEVWCGGRGVADVDRVFFARTPTARCGDRTCVPYSRWVADFYAIASAPGGGATESRPGGR
jgi:putative spermidine/putrescine transport system substrate-binding protein